MEDFIKKVLEWDVINWNRAIKCWEEKLTSRTPHTGDALELGGRKGGPSMWLASKGYQVVCSDLESPESIAGPMHETFNLRQNIRYESMNAMDIPYENHFDVIIFKSILGGIGRNNQISNQQQTIDQIYKALKKGGVLLFAENLSASPIHRFFRRKFTNWGDSWRYLSKQEIQTFLKGFDAHEIQTTGFIGAFGRTEKQRNLFGKADQLFFNAIVPNKWRYISYGWAQK